MKAKKSGQAKKARTGIVHKRTSQRRSVHKRVLLHPISAFLLLCVGVLVAGSTFHGQAVSYDVTARVSAPALTEPAIITEPTNQQHVLKRINVQGACPSDSYVKVFRGDVLSGVDICTDGRFTVHTDLLPGSNQLQAHIFNFTDEEGPVSSPITVYYDLSPLVDPPASVPVSLQVSNVEKSGYQPGVIREVTGNPTVSGLAPPFSSIVVTFYSEPSVCKTKADSKGVWSCTLANALPPGIHHVVIEATTPAGKKMTLPTFEVRVVEYIQPFAITSDYRYSAYQEGQTVEWKLAFSGGTAPYELLVHWGDGESSRLVRQDQSEFTISHTYDATELVDNYSVLITAVDARGATTVLQLATTIKGSTLVSAEQGLLGGITDTVRQWLWVVWPAYIAVVLMAISFWIGEREAYKRFVARRRLGRRPHARGR
jgi:hypothetical protein